MTIYQNGVMVLEILFDALKPDDIWEVVYERLEPGTIREFRRACYFVDEEGALNGPWPTASMAMRVSRDRRAARAAAQPPIVAPTNVAGNTSSAGGKDRASTFSDWTTKELFEELRRRIEGDWRTGRVE
jgi:hypothetical protein